MTRCMLSAGLLGRILPQPRTVHRMLVRTARDSSLTDGWISSRAGGAEPAGCCLAGGGRGRLPLSRPGGTHGPEAAAAPLAAAGTAGAPDKNYKQEKENRQSGMCRKCTGSRNISNRFTISSGSLSEDQTLVPVAAGCPMCPARGLSSTYKCGHIMECLFSLKWNLCSFLSRGVIKISFLLLASPKLLYLA